MSFAFRLWSVDDAQRPAVVFEDTTTAAYVPVWEEIGVYDALYNSDGRQAREVSRAIAYGVDRLAEGGAFARLLPPTTSLGEAIRFLENILRGCTIHANATIETR